MLFNSFEFLLFFPAVAILFFLLPHKLRWLHLLMASFLFYMAFLPVYILILAVTIVVDYFAGIYIERSAGSKRKWILVASIVANVGFLCFFKYYDFIIGNLNTVIPFHIPVMDELWISSVIVQWNNYVNHLFNTSLGTDFPILQNIILPIGLSFHTFQAMSYTIEVYKGRQTAERHFGIYALYVMFFPQLVAGPIERPQNVIHQFHEKKYFNTENLITGARLIAWGLFKKVVIADRASLYVDIVYSDPSAYHWLNLLLASLFFTIQIYCDFSGYSDIAIGSARIMGYDLMTNFRRPYFATNIKEFWSKWHISLSTWFRDYLYIPLGGNRVKYSRYLLNIAIVFVVSGIWHGANWTFIVWGGLHAAYQVGYIVYERYADKKGWNRDTWLGNFLGWFVTFGAVVFAWIFFRAKDLNQAWLFIRNMMTFQTPAPFKMTLLAADERSGFGITSMLLIALFGTALLYVEKYYRSDLSELNNRPKMDLAFITLTVAATIVFGVFVRESFIYFQF
ncbi:MAG: MBOAT family protein [Chitinophagales bacterium]|nr:MBOAT family protein [Chitinophagales bacterium]